MDRFYTPPALADTLVESVSAVQPRAVADFAAGDGRLLAAASERWPRASILAADIHTPTLRRLQRKYPEWIVLRVDFLSEGPPPRHRLFARRRFDVVLLNPPFSCRGASKWITICGKREVHSGRAMAFVLRALEFVKPGGELLAILPAGSTTSQKDEAAWAAVRRRASVTVLQKNGYRTFEGCYPKTVLVRIKRIPGGDAIASAASNFDGEAGFDVVRGGLQVHKIVENKKGVALIHSTSLQGSRIRISKRVSYDGRLFSGPAVLIPRVGAPRMEKIAVLREGRRGVLTDCVLAVRCESTESAHALQASIRARWTELEQLYRGTCAQYLTIRDLQAFLASVPSVGRQAVATP
jgi:hypothetical protein